ncbi:MAG: hypothetical protein HY039_04300 [Nitrospirae bacterium]|nr:hypothetical protein [Nitrospirota bacterium]
MQRKKQRPVVPSLPGPLDVNLGNNAQYAYPVVKPRPLSKAGSAPPVVKAGQPQLPMLPDITSGTGVTIGGKSAPWGSSVTVDVKDAHSVNMNNSGLCEFAIKHTARNIGLASTGGFDSEWKNSNVPGSWGRSWGSIASGGSKEETDLVALKPGQNFLHLTLDNLKKVQEVSENDNQFQVGVNVTGSCGPKPGSGQPGAGASPRLPAVQQPQGR